MKNMKKNDGYVVVYVLIVFTILSLVAVSICSVALKNLKAQRASVDRMEVRYEAEAYLQEFVAKIGQLKLEFDVSHAEAYDTQEEIVQKVKEDLAAQASAGLSITANSFAFSDESASLEIEAVYTDADGRTAKIDAELLVPVAVQLIQDASYDNPETTEITETLDQYTYEVSGPIQYKDYTISYEGGGA